MKTPTWLALPSLLALLAGSGWIRAQETFPEEQVPGGIVVQLAVADLDAAARLSRTGRYLVDRFETDPAAVAAAREALRAKGLYGLARAGILPTAGHLPYAENLVNLVEAGTQLAVPLPEIFRVLVPRGLMVVSPQAGLTPASLQAAGFEAVSVRADGRLVARKPWPAAMDGWSHPRHSAGGNAVSGDTAVGPPERVRWVAAATSEVEGLVTAGGRNFYGGVLARDGFNGLRLWHRDLGSGKRNDPGFVLPALSDKRARPVASEPYLFATMQQKLVALGAGTGEVLREFAVAEEPRELLHNGEVLVSAGENRVSAFAIQTGEKLWEYAAGEPRHLVLDERMACFLTGRVKRGEPSEAVALDVRSGKIRWRQSGYPWLDKVSRMVMHGEQIAFEVSSLNDFDAGNELHLLHAETGEPRWEKQFPPGMNHARQARAMFTPSGLWILHGGKLGGPAKETVTRMPVQVSALDPRTGETLRTLPAGLAHCFPPVATVRYLLSGVFDLTDLETGRVDVNPITKANCSREAGWIPANGLIYTTPKHCTCWPMLRGFVALAPAAPGGGSLAKKPLEELDFPLVKGAAAADPEAAEPVPADWPAYRCDPWRSGSSLSEGPAAIRVKWSVPLQPAGDASAGPILADWRENPFIKGPVSAPTVAGGQVFVARPDAQEVLALRADTGAVMWRFTAHGRVDLPPVIYRGLALFGCHGGYVYALRTDNGQLVWQFRAAPGEEQIVAYGQLESPWPVPGAVLVRKDTAYFVAGRQPLADGGVFVFAVDPLTGQKRWVHRLDKLPHQPDPAGKDPYQGYYENSALEFDPVDILHQEGEGIAMSRWVFASDGSSVEVDKWKAFAQLDTGGGAVWVPRGSWCYAARHQARFRGDAARRPLVVFRDGEVYGQLEGCTELFRRDFDAESLAKFDGKWITGWAVSQLGSKGEKPFRTYRLAEHARWKVDPFTAAADQTKPFVPGTQLFNDVYALALAKNHRLYAIHRDGRLKVIDTQDGAVLSESQVPAPLWDGLAIARGELYLTTSTGTVCCLGSAGAGR